MDVELAKLALKNIEAEPQKWNQADWRCSTGMCFAGHVVYAAGGRWVEEDWNRASYQNCHTVVLPDGRTGVVSAIAHELLGTIHSDDSLFLATNTLDDLKRLIDIHSE